MLREWRNTAPRTQFSASFRIVVGLALCGVIADAARTRRHALAGRPSQMVREPDRGLCLSLEENRSVQ